MDCKHVNERLVDYLYQELDADQADRIEGHIRQCEGCTDELTAFESTRRLMQQLPQLQPSSSIVDSLVREAERAVQPQSPGLWERLRAGLSMLVMHPAMTAAVALVLVLGVSFYAYQRTSPPTRSSLPSRVDLPEVEDGVAVAPQPAGMDRTVVEANNRVTTPLVTNLDKQPPTVVALAPKTGDSISGRLGEGRLGKGGATRTAAVRRHRARPARRPKARAVAAAPPAARPTPKPRPTTRYRKGPSADAFDDLVSGALAQNKNDIAGKKAGKKKGEDTQAEKKESAAPWLAKARIANKKGRCDQALRLYHRALEIEPALRRLVGPEVRRCARVLATSGGSRLEQAQQQLPLLAGWLEAEISEVRRASKAQKKQAAPPAKATPAKPVQAYPSGK